MPGISFAVSIHRFHPDAVLVPLQIGPTGSWLCYSVTLCRPEWRLPTELRMGDWIFRSPAHWDVIDRDFLRSLPAR